MAGVKGAQSATATLEICKDSTFRVLNVTAHAAKPDVRDFLDARTGRSYTSIVTVLGASRVPALERHAKRVGAPPGGVLTALAALRWALQPREGAELFAVLVSGEAGASGRIDALAFTTASRDGAKRPASVAVEVGGAPRERPQAKCTSWSARRRPLEARCRNACAETVLADADGRMYEGLVTNLFVVTKNGTVVTAPENAVLNGVVREAVLQICAERGIKVARRCPDVRDADEFRAAFLTNVARYLQPVHSFWWGGHQIAVQGGAKWERFVDEIRAAVWARMVTAATAFDDCAEKEGGATEVADVTGIKLP